MGPSFTIRTISSKTTSELFLLTTAHRFGTANQLMPFTYSFLIYVAIWGYLLFGTVPDGGTLMGAVVIMGAGLIIWKREKT